MHGSTTQATVQPGLGTLAALVRRDLKRFVRQPSRIIAAIGTPVLIWLLLGSGFAGSFMNRAASTGNTTGNYAAYLVPGMASMVALFASIFASISLIEDRHEGFLQAVLTSPTPAWLGVAARAASCVLMAVAQGGIVLLAGPLVGVPLTIDGFVLGLVALGLLACVVTGVGLAAAWRVDSVSGFHGVMNMLLMPMWMLSGAVFPLAGAAGWLGWVMRLNPLTYATEALREGVNHEASIRPIVAWGVAVLAAAVSLWLAAWVTRKRS